MRVGVLDSDGNFDNIFFKNKHLTILRKDNIKDKRENIITHGEYVCSHIFRENPDVEIILVPVINYNMKCSVQDLIDGINLLMDCEVDIINMSIGDEYKYHYELEEICRRAWHRGILIVAAHSNNNVKATYPADFLFVLGVRCMNESNPQKIMRYIEEKNEIYFSSSYFSLYHLGIPKLLSGNSFACAKITGMLSHHKETYKKYLREFEISKFNLYYPYKLLKKKTSYLLTDRLDDPLEHKFMRDVTNTVKYEGFPEGLKKSLIDKKRFTVLFIDHSNYNEILPYKEEIKRYINENPDKEIVLRFPLFGLEERMVLYKEYGIVINQFYI